MPFVSLWLPMKLTLRQRRSLQAICDTFAPNADGWPSASELGIPEAIAEAMDFNPRMGDRKQFLQLLDFWDSPLHALFSIRQASHFSTLPAEARIRVLLSWADSGFGRRRAAFQALRKAVSYLYVMLPGLNGARTPVWDKLGYPGPPGIRNSTPSSGLSVIVPQQEMRLLCEICIVGAGAGGGTAAGILAAAGKDVIVLEA